MNDLITIGDRAFCRICDERYHVEQGMPKINGRFTRRCIAFHKESDHPSIQLENTRRFMEGEPEVRVNRSDWYSKGGEVLENSP